MRFRGVAYVVLVLALLSACGDGEERAPDVISAGQLDIKLPPGWTVTEDGARRPAAPIEGEAAAPAADGATEDTVPLAEEDPTTEFFESTNKFQQCLKDRGTSFRGIPGQGDPNGPANDPAYIEDLSTCAAKSNIVQTMEGFNAAQDQLTPEEVEEQNEGFLRWRTCMIGRGWDIPKPKPDSKGRLFSIGGGNTPQMTPPPGKDLMSSGDLQECAAETQR